MKMNFRRWAFPSGTRKTTEKENSTHRVVIHPWRWRALTLWIAIFTAVNIYLVHQNSNRIKDMQSQRLASCKRTYEGVREVLLPFFPEPGKQTDKQMHDLKKFNDRVDELKRGCRKQISEEPNHGVNTK